MKITFSFILLVLFVMGLNPIPTTADQQIVCLEDDPIIIKDDVVQPPLCSIDSIKLLIHSMIHVESRGNDSSFCKKENAVGCLQIRPVMVKEVNRFLRKLGNEKRYTLDERWSREKSIEMFRVWYNYRHSESTLEVIARSWNGGPRGPKRKSTLNYWKKVKSYYDELDYYNYMGRYRV
tara:strand:- start:35 stop:568 length:534 start_codon:yes stop_codon:yes gene_type:complete